MSNRRTTIAGITAVLTFIVATIAKRYGLQLPDDVTNGIVIVILAIGLKLARDAHILPDQPFNSEDNDENQS